MDCIWKMDVFDHGSRLVTALCRLVRHLFLNAFSERCGVSGRDPTAAHWATWCLEISRDTFSFADCLGSQSAHALFSIDLVDHSSLFGFRMIDLAVTRHSGSTSMCSSEFDQFSPRLLIKLGCWFRSANVQLHVEESFASLRSALAVFMPLDLVLNLVIRCP